MKTKITYECEFCGRLYSSEEEVLRCESQGAPKSLIKLGDKFKFSDCKETPIAYGGTSDFAWYSFCMTGGKEIEIECINIEKNGHAISYWFGTEDSNGNLILSTNDITGELISGYPIVYGNELMQKILDKQ